MRESSRPRSGWNGTTGPQLDLLLNLAVEKESGAAQSESTTTTDSHLAQAKETTAPSSPKLTNASEPREVDQKESATGPGDGQPLPDARPLSSSRASSFASAQPSHAVTHVSSVGFARARGHSAAPVREEKDRADGKGEAKAGLSASPPLRPQSALPESAPSSASNSVSGSARSTTEVASNSNRGTMDSNSNRSTLDLSSLSDEDRKVCFFFFFHRLFFQSVETVEGARGPALA
jgi:hypothetical protein